MSNLSVRKFPIATLMYPGSLSLPSQPCRERGNDRSGAHASTSLWWLDSGTRRKTASLPPPPRGTAAPKGSSVNICSVRRKQRPRPRPCQKRENMVGLPPGGSFPYPGGRSRGGRPSRGGGDGRPLRGVKRQLFSCQFFCRVRSVKACTQLRPVVERVVCSSLIGRFARSQKLHLED